MTAALGESLVLTQVTYPPWTSQGRVSFPSLLRWLLSLKTVRVVLRCFPRHVAFNCA